MKKQATRVTLVLDEEWMKVIANHHSVAEVGEVFQWESSEPVEVEVEEDEDIPVTITILSADLEWGHDWVIRAVFTIHRPDMDLTYLAIVTRPRDEDEPESIEVWHQGDSIDNFDEDLGREIQQTILDRVDFEWQRVIKVHKEVEFGLTNAIISTSTEAVR